MREHNQHMQLQLVEERSATQCCLFIQHQEAEMKEDLLGDAAKCMELTISAYHKLGLELPPFLATAAESVYADWHDAIEEARDARKTLDRKIEKDGRLLI
jgi:hypothetical protein